MISAAAILVVLVAQQGPIPPYKRVHTTPVFEAAYSPAVTIDGSTLFVANHRDCFAYDLRTSSRLWTFTAGAKESLRDLVFDKGVLFALSTPAERNGSGSIIAIDPKDGAKRWSIPRKGEDASFDVDGGFIYASLNPLSVSAIDVSTRKTKWTTPFPKPEEEFTSIDSVTGVGKRVLVNVGSISYCLDSSNGKVQWSEPASYMFGDYFLIHEGIVLVPSGEGSVAREVTTGTELWRNASTSYSDGGEIFEGLFVVLDSGKLAALDPKTGKQQWSFPVGDPNWAGGFQFVKNVGGLLHVRGLGKATIIDKSGKKLWEGKDEESLPGPVWTDGKSIVCFDRDRILRYEHGAEDAIPTGAGRAKLAESLVAKFDELDDADKRRLVALEDDAFPPLLKEYLATCAKYDGVPEGGDSYPLYSRFHDIGELLKSVAATPRSADIMTALDKLAPNSSAKPLLLSLLAEKGKPEEATPYFLKELENAKTPGFEMYESTTYVARSYIVRSKDPRAVAFMLKLIKDPKADEVMRYEAYTHLAGTGGEEGVKAVLGERRARQLLRPLTERAIAEFKERGAREKKVLEMKSADGTVWGLLELGVLGSNGDLWLAKKQGHEWSDLVFLGVSTEGVSGWVEPKVKEPTVAGKTAADLVKADWLKLLAADSSIRKDSDGDGLTDVAENRLGTNAASKDTDGDGDGDERDPWPNAPKRQLSEAEKVLASAFEAKYHTYKFESPAIFFAPAGLRPFEMVGWSGPVIWSVDDRWSHPLEWCYEQGVGFIRFGEYVQDASKAWDERVIRWNADRSEATVMLSTYYGGLNGSGYRIVVRKFGEEWLPIEVVMEYVS